MIIKRVDEGYIQCKQFENENIRRERDPLTFIELFICTVSMLLILCSLIFYSWRSLEYLRSQYELRSLENQVKELKEENQKLLLEMEYLSSPEKINYKAFQEVGLVPTEPERIIVLDPGQESISGRVRIAVKSDTKQDEPIN
jgi:cell division protein FtsL